MYIFKWISCILSLDIILFLLLLVVVAISVVVLVSVFFHLRFIVLHGSFSNYFKGPTLETLDNLLPSYDVINVNEHLISMCIVLCYIEQEKNFPLQS